MIAMSKGPDMREVTYQLAISFAKNMLKKDLISREEYSAFEDKLKGKYKPVIGPIYSDMDLI